MYTLEELNSWDDERLLKKAEELGIPNPVIDEENREKLAFDIIDKSAEDTAKEVVNSVNKRKAAKPQVNSETEEEQPKKRGRKPKAKTDKNDKTEKTEKGKKPKKNVKPESTPAKPA